MTRSNEYAAFNEYAALFGPLYRRTPKAVFAAVAYSFADVVRLLERYSEGEGADQPIHEFLNEWKMLYEKGIVPQAPPKEPAR